MYRFYLKQGEQQFLFPVTPSEVTTKMGNCNQTVQIYQIGEVNLLRNRKLEEIQFRVLLPGRQYPFVQAEEGFREPVYYLQQMKAFQEAKKPVQLIVFRRLADGTQIFCSNTEMGLEAYTVTEKGGEQGDFWLELVLREYRQMQSIAYRPMTQNGTTVLQKQQTQRPAKEPAKTYTVQKGDNLWNIAKKELGDGTKFQELAQKNGIANPSLIYPGQILQL